MKRIIALVLSIMMVGSCFITGCGKKDEKDNTNKPGNELSVNDKEQGEQEEQKEEPKEDDKGEEKPEDPKDESKPSTDTDKKDETTTKPETKPDTSTSKPSTGNTNNNNTTSKPKPDTSKPKPDTSKPNPDTSKPKPEQPSEAFSGDLSSILSNIATKGGIKDDMPRSMDTKITADNIQGYLGLSSEEYNANISEAMVQEAMIIAQAHMIGVIKAKDATAATNVKNLIAKKFDPRRWVCVQPQKCIVIKSGSYVLFVASSNEVSDGMINGFKNIAGSTADAPNCFFKGME